MRSSPTLCVDASLVVPFISASSPENVLQLWGEWRTRHISLVAPRLLRYEVVNAIRRTMIPGNIDLPTARLGVQSLLDLPIELRDTDSMHERALLPASHFNLPATYDAHYLALAEELDCEFWTADKRLANVVRDELDWVHLFE